MLFDVEVTGRDGSPIRGLTLKDFKVRLDDRDWPIESVDDLCSCGDTTADGGARAAIASETSVAHEGDLGSLSAPPAADPVHFILYLDFIQLQLDGRTNAIKAAKRWIEEVMQPEDRVMIVGHSSAAGLRTISPFTTDRRQLIAALDSAYVDPAFNDPFPSYLLNRQWDCMEGNPQCPINVAEEYQYGRRSLETLRRLLATLESVPGRKQLVLFMQNGTIQPGALYARKSPDHDRRVDEVVGEATMSRVVINAASLSARSVDLAMRLAQPTGGLYTRIVSDDFMPDVFPMMERARRRCACIYRIGLQPPEAKTRMHRVKVFVRGRALPYSYMTGSLTAIDRWLRTAQAVLANPSASRHLAVTAGFVPVRADDGRWEVNLKVALDLGSLTMLPSEEGRQGTWEVGAALVRGNGGPEDSWEMLGTSEVRKAAAGASTIWVVHERRFVNLRPGDYRMAAFVRDTTANVFGGAEAAIVLPKPDEDGLAGPVLMRADRRQVVTMLPLLRSAGKTQESRVATMITGSIPAGDSPALALEPLEVSTWVCGRAAAPLNGRLLRFIAANEMPILRFEESAPEPAGQCLKITDRIERWEPASGDYSYRVQWVGAEGQEIGAATVPFAISRTLERASAAPSP